jgi:hypothetical protein
LKFNWVTGELNPLQGFGPGGIRTCVTEALGTDLKINHGCIGAQYHPSSAKSCAKTPVIIYNVLSFLQVVFVGEIGSGVQSDIALDDINIRTGSCSGKDYYCMVLLYFIAQAYVRPARGVEASNSSQFV